MDPLDEVRLYDTEHRDRLLRRAALLTKARADGLAGHRETIQVLATLLAISPHIRPTFDAPGGRRGRPSEQWEPIPPQHAGRPLPRIPRQRTAPPAGVPGQVRPRRSR